jgi:flagellin
MSLNSVNTNSGAMIALQSLNRTNSQLAATQKQISTGYRVADATDDGAAYAVAQSVRSTVSALTSANQQLGTVQGLLSTTQSALNNVSNTMTKMRDVLVKLSDSDVSGTQRSQYQAQYTSLLANVNTFIQDAGYNGKTLIGNITGSSGTYGRVTTVRNESGASYGIASFSGASLITAITIDFTTVTTAAAVSALLISATGTFIQQMDNVGDGLNMVGSEVNYVNNQISYNSNKVDALNTGLGSLVDADLAKESAALQALQIRQQLGTQALSMANQAPQTLLSLFK